jgi:hypothetical protein
VIDEHTLHIAVGEFNYNVSTLSSFGTYWTEIKNILNGSYSSFCAYEILERGMLLCIGAKKVSNKFCSG